MRSLYRYGAYRFWRRKLKPYVPEADHGLEFLVDCGCGAGYLLSYLTRWFPTFRIIGVDITQERLSDVTNSSVSGANGAALIRASADELPLATGSVTIMISLHLVEHLAEPTLFLQEARRVLRPGGVLVLATPNLGSLGAKVRKGRWEGYKDPTHISLKTAKEWRTLVEKSGFELKSYGTTSLGLPGLRQITWGVLYFMGYLRWELGESFVCLAKKQGERG